MIVLLTIAISSCWLFPDRISIKLIAEDEYAIGLIADQSVYTAEDTLLVYMKYPQSQEGGQFPRRWRLANILESDIQFPGKYREIDKFGETTIILVKYAVIEKNPG